MRAFKIANYHKLPKLRSAWTKRTPTHISSIYFEVPISFFIQLPYSMTVSACSGSTILNC